MDKKAMLNTLDRLLDEAKVAILANTGSDGFPAVRWMSPTLIRGRDGFIYAVTSKNFAKTSEIDKKSEVMWMVQTKSLDEICSVKGRMSVISNPSLVSEVQEAIGGKLGTFWKMNQDTSAVVVLETEIVSVEHFNPTNGIKNSVDFTK